MASTIAARTLVACACLCAFALPRSAFAQASAAAGDGDEASRELPGFATLDRGDARSRFGVEFSYLFLSDNGTNNNQSLTSVRLEVHAQYVDPGTGFGGYALTPFGYFGNFIGDNSGWGIGNFEAGGLWVPHFTFHGIAFVARIGLVVPTATTTSGIVPTQGSIDQVLANGYASLARLTDDYLSIPDGTSMRFSGSALYRHRAFFARFDLGVDGNFSSANDTNVGNQLRLNLGVGVDLGPASLTFESVNTDISNETIGQSSASVSGWFATGALSARFRSGPADVYAAVVLPFDHATHEPYGALFPTFGAALTLGVEGKL